MKVFPNVTPEADDPFHYSECPMAWKIEDLLMDARDIEEETLPFTDDYDGPEVEEL